ncbi:matrixin family metalloprotease [Fontisphaera persica]|uniref:matrixin family metalloprotease n=1 Tax=Fontisphaera persica TaxID=2974023 RepID=UPI0024C0326B|nr:matrixin family metalloprotease [Fontisphaera persica]WCJ58511.1 matrixin family metalloprotease [Fontisphaera persica]
MKRLLPLLWMCLGAAGVSGFVLDYDEENRPLRWDLLELPDLVKTNSVNPQTRAIRYFVAEDAWSVTNRAAEIQAVRASFEQWEAVAGTHLKFEFAGLAPAGMDVNTEDGTNVVYWAKQSLLVNGGRDSISGTLGVCFYTYFPGNLLAEADIVLNGVQRRWYTDFSATNGQAYFVEGVTLHEIGHWLGLSHSPVGGATMLAYGDIGQSSQSGLSADEIAAVRTLYPASGTMSNLAHLRGTVTKGGQPVVGAAVFLEDANGTLVGGTATRANGQYLLTAVPPGAYALRVAPLDPPVNHWLVAGFELGPEYAGADVNFLTTSNHPVTLTAGVTNVFNVTVTAAVPPFRITQIREPTANPLSFVISSVPIKLRPGQSNLTVGVFSADLPTNGLDLKITGPGITHGALTAHPPGSPFNGLSGLSVVVSVSSNATPGMRSLVVTRPNDGARAYAPGFVEIQPLVPDFNFDGLDDRFQRQYFARFTLPEAAPAADPDRDGMPNTAEAVAGTVPTNALSVLKVERVVQDASGTTIFWRSVPGKRYQVWARDQVENAPWQAMGEPVQAAGSTASALDVGATQRALRFYRVQVLP